MVRKLVLCCIVGSCVTLLLGCPKKKENAELEAGVEEAGAVDAAPPPPAVPAAPVTKNGADVARFPAAEKPLVDDTAAFPEFLPVPEEHGTAVVVLGPRTVLMSADAPQTAALYRSRGLEVVTTPITEFEKLEGCVTCLSVRIR